MLSSFVGDDTAFSARAVRVHTIRVRRNKKKTHTHTTYDDE